MTVTYEEAREIVRSGLEPDWEGGTFCLDDRFITENDDKYAFNVGNREYIVDGNHDFQLYGNLPVVHKADGRLEWVPSVDIAMDDSLERRPNPSPTLRP